MPETHAITKYPNRRLYSKVESRYVTLADVTQLVRQGTDVQVTLRRTAEDITRQILLGCLMVEGEEALCSAALHMILRGGAVTVDCRKPDF